MKIDVLTIFPEFFREVFDFGIIRRAKLAEIVEINIHDIREFTLDKHRKVDDRPYGGGDGMVLMCEPIFRVIENLIGTAKRENYPNSTRIVLLTPQGKPLKQDVAKEFATEANHIILICGRYEGVDERVEVGLYVWSFHSSRGVKLPLVQLKQSQAMAQRSEFLSSNLPRLRREALTHQFINVAFQLLQLRNGH